jgi:hypothetical protein
VFVPVPPSKKRRLRLLAVGGRERERARERNGEMDALRKQASRFKEQVAKQQQVRIPRPILPFHYLAAVLFFLLRACSVEPGWIEGIGVE